MVRPVPGNLKLNMVFSLPGKRPVMIALWIAGGVLVLGAGALLVLSLTASRPENLGVQNGRLAECPGTPNCVSSQAAEPGEAIPPFAVSGDPGEAFARLRSIVAQDPRSRIVVDRDDYLHAEFTSRLFRFTDDVEFLLDPAGRVIHVRSASRVGRSDLGANRQRVEALRTRYQQSADPRPERP